MNQMSYAVASESVERSVEVKLSPLNLGNSVASDRLVLAYHEFIVSQR